MFLAFGMAILSIPARKFLFGSPSDTAGVYVKTAIYAGVLGLLLSVCLSFMGCVRWLLWVF